MITTSNLDSFYTWCINTNVDVRRTKEKYRDILKILTLNIEEESLVLYDQNKARILSSIITMIIDKGYSIESAVSNIIHLPKYEDDTGVTDYLHHKLYEKIDEDRFLKAVMDIDSLAKLALIKDEIPALEDMVDKLREGSYDTIDEGYNLLRDIASNLNTAVKKVDRTILMATESSIAVGNDETDKVVENILLRYDKLNRIPTGFDYLDDVIMHGGFEKNRLYTWAGSSASGKSTILTNMAINAATFTYPPESVLSHKLKVFLYITLENDKEESYLRMLCSHFNLSYIEVLRQLSQNRTNLPEQFKEAIFSHNSIIHTHQLPSNAISSVNIGSIIEDLKEKYPDCIVPAVYIDYLDLMKSDAGGKDLRLNLSDICSELKNLAIEYEIPVITATQLNRDAFKVKSSFDLSVALVAESINKVFISDFVALMAKNPEDHNLVHFRVGKFRSGNPDAPLDFKVNFEHYKFISCQKSKPKKQEEKEPLPDGFGGLQFDERNLF